MIHRSSDPSRAEVSVSDGVAPKNIAVGSHQNGVLDPIGAFERGQIKPAAVHDQVARHFGVGQTPFHLNDGPGGAADAVQIGEQDQLQQLQRRALQAQVQLAWEIGLICLDPTGHRGQVPIAILESGIDEEAVDVGLKFGLKAEIAQG